MTSEVLVSEATAIASLKPRPAASRGPKWLTMRASTPRAVIASLAPRQTRLLRRDLGRPLSETSVLMLLRRMGHGDITTHGFRSTFRAWATERTTVAREVAEMALAHAIPDAVEAPTGAATCLRSAAS
jgi:integrase